MVNYIVILSSCFLLFTASAGLATKYENCSTSETQNGKCVVIRECPPILNLLKTKPIPPEYVQRLRQAHCGFQEIHPKVCCPVDASGVVVTAIKPPTSDPTFSNLLPNLNQCGVFPEDRLINSMETQIDGYPWTVLLDYETSNGNGFHCGGVLINNRYVLTAAHCISGKGVEKNWKLVGVRLGEYDRDSDPDCVNFLFGVDCADKVINVEIEEKIVHEQYDPNNKAQYYDIALLRFVKNVNFTDFVRPICLQPAKYLTNGSLPGEIAAISGWGITELSSNSNKKQWSTMQLRNKTECETAYSNEGLQLREDQICAFASKGKNSCSQDSGGALMKYNQELVSSFNYFAVGVMSIGHPICGLNEYPVIYTKVENYISWIVSKLKP